MPPHILRVMKEEGGKPATGKGAALLGVRSKDLGMDGDAPDTTEISPDTGGMSVGGCLRLLRFRQDRFSPPGVAYARGRAYGILGFLNVATVFMRLASGLAPQQSYYKMALLTLLNRQERSDELDKELEVMLTDPATDPDTVVVAVTLSFMRAVRASMDLARTYLGELRRTLQRALDKKPPQTMKPATAFMGLHTLGSIQDRLNRPMKAQELYRQALRINPQDQTVRVSLALSLLQNNEIEAFRLFGQVAAEGTRFEVAYLFAAKHAGEQGRFADAAVMAEKAITIAGNPLAVAYAHEFLAVSEAELNGLTDKAREHFAEALRLAPDNTNVQSNYDLFHAKLAMAEVRYSNETEQKQPPTTWLLTDATLVEVYRLGLQTNQDGITKSLDEESKQLDTATAENLTRQSKFARAA